MDTTTPFESRRGLARVRERTADGWRYGLVVVDGVCADEQDRESRRIRDVALGPPDPLPTLVDDRPERLAQ
jgi:hypothetical protein